MIEDLFGNIGAHQEKLKKRLQEIEFTVESPDGSISITLTAAKTIRDLRLKALNPGAEDVEQWEDLLLITLNQALDQADDIASKETSKLISSMLPPGFGNLFG